MVEKIGSLERVLSGTPLADEVLRDTRIPLDGVLAIGPIDLADSQAADVGGIGAERGRVFHAQRPFGRCGQVSALQMTEKMLQ